MCSAARLHSRHVHVPRDLMVRIARKHLGYCIGLEIKEPIPEELAQMNAKIQIVLQTLTAAEAKCWCYHERPLFGHTQKYYTDALAGLPATRTRNCCVCRMLRHRSKCWPSRWWRAVPGCGMALARRVPVFASPSAESADLGLVL